MQNKEATPLYNRVSSIDILRALTMLLMIFVNDLWSLKNIPEWLEHVSADADGMGLADTVFPAFLFISGMSIPLAVQQRRKRGESDFKIAMHILERSFALLVMGLFLVNGEYLNEVATGMKRGLWNTLSCISFILLWNAWPKTMNKQLIRVLKVIAVAILIFLAWHCRSGEAGDRRFTTYWWGILGLIGWAYLVSALIFTFSKNSIVVCLIAWVILNVLCMMGHSGLIPGKSLAGYLLGPIASGGMPAFMLGGIVTTQLFLHFRQKGENNKLILVLTGIAVALFLLGVYTNNFWPVSKIKATPPWIFICSAITIVAFVFLYWLADLKGKASWFDVVKPAGNNTLLCYLLPYFAYALVVALHLHLPEVVLAGGIGLLKSFFFSLLIVVVAGWLGKIGLRLKL